MKAKRVEIIFSDEWIMLETVFGHGNPIKGYLSALELAFDITEIETEKARCVFMVNDKDITVEGLTEKIYGIIREKSKGNPENGIISIHIKSETDVADGKERERKLDEIKKSVARLVGAEEFKTLMQEICAVAEGIKKNNLYKVLSSRAYIFSINDGEGLSEYAELMAKMFNTLGVVKMNTEQYVSECSLSAPGQKNGNEESAFSEAMRTIGLSRGGAKVIVIDMSEWMNNVTDKSFRNFLGYINDCGKNNIIIFRVPFVEKDVLSKIKNAVSDVLSVREISFIPFDSGELAELAKAELDSYGYTAQEDVWELFSDFINAEKRDGRFYGIKTVEKLIREMLYCKQVQNSLDGTDDKILKVSELEKMGCVIEDERDAFECFDDMIGMDEIKKRVVEITQQIKESIRNKGVEAPCIHMRFVGNPGTGKTTVARLLGKALRQNGILRNGNFFECHGRSLCGRYVGETSPKTSAICRDAYGSVLFIDEAYSLYRSDIASRGDYGQEAIDTLIAEMENHRSDLVVIMAGYTDEMDELMRANSGLESRMPYVIEFPNYTRDQLFCIFMDMVKKNYEYNSAFEDEAKRFFDAIPDDVLSSKDFSNARFVRNLFERTWGKAVMRATVNRQECSVLTKEDFLMATGEKEFRKIMEKKEKRTIGFA